MLNPFSNQYLWVLRSKDLTYIGCMVSLDLLVLLRVLQEVSRNKVLKRCNTDIARLDHKLCPKSHFGNTKDQAAGRVLADFRT